MTHHPLECARHIFHPVALLTHPPLPCRAGRVLIFAGVPLLTGFLVFPFLYAPAPPPITTTIVVHPG
jgi:hypothetical protein